MKRKVFSIVLCLCLLLTLVPANTFAAANDTGLAEGLYWCWADEISDGVFQYNSNARLEEDISGSYPGRMDMVFVYLDANGNRNLLKCSDLTSTGSYFRLRDDLEVVVGIHYLGTGTGGTISYTNNAGVTFSRNIDSVFRAPDFYFYNGSTPSAQTCIEREFNFDGTNNKLYFIASNGCELYSYNIQGRMADKVTASQINNDCIEITINESTAEGDLQIHYTGKNSRGETVSENDGILIKNNCPALRWSWPKEIGDMDFEYDPDAPLESDIQGVYPGSMFMVFVFRNANGNVTPLNCSDLKAHGSFFELRDYQTNVVEVVYKGVGGGGTITYTSEGTDYVINIDSSFWAWDFGFYKDSTVTAENCITQDYLFDGTNDTFYFLPSNGCTVRSCHIVSDLEDKITATVENGYVQFEIKDPNTNGYLTIEFDGTDADGNNITDRRFGLNINNTQPALGWRWPGSWQQDTPISSNEDPYFDGMNPSKGYQWDVEFVLDNKDGNAPEQIPFSKLVFSGTGDDGGKLMEASSLPNGFVQIQFLDWGTGTISYEDASGKTYSIDVRSDLPSSGFYSSPTASKADFLDGGAWKYDGQSNRVYYICTDPELSIDSDPVWVGGSPVTFTKQSSKCVEINLTQLDKGNPYIEFEVSFKTPYGSTVGPWREYLIIDDRRPGLFWRPASRQFDGNGDFTIVSEPSHDPYDSPMRFGPGDNMDFEVFFSKKDGSGLIQIPYSELKPSGSCFKLTNLQDEFAFIEALSWGSGKIEWTDTSTGTTYALDVSVEIPELAFYSQPSATQSSYLPMQIWEYNGTNNTIYFIPYPADEFKLEKAEWADGAPCDVALDKTNNCAKITMKPDYSGEKFLGITFETIDPDGNSYGDHTNYINIKDMRPCLMIEAVYYDEDGTRHTRPIEDTGTDMALNEELHILIKADASGNYIESGVVSSDPSVASIRFDEDLNCWVLTALSEGYCELQFTDASGAVITRSINVYLGSGIYKDQTASAEGLVHAEDKIEYTSGEECIVYYVNTEDPSLISSVAVKSGAVTVEKVSDGVYSIQVAGDAVGDINAVIAVTLSVNGKSITFEYEINFTEKTSAEGSGEDPSDTPSTPGSGGGGGTNTPDNTPVEEPAEEMVTVEVEDPQTGEVVEVEVTKDAAEASEKFDDVEPTDWYADAVGKAVEAGYMAGTGEKTFSPETTLTRGMLAQMLYVMAGMPAMEGEADYSDVDPDDWYAKAIAWTSENGVAVGYGESFGAEDPVTREQMVTMLLAYAKFMGYDIVEGADLSQYADETSISSWAEAAMAWAKGADLISGRSEVILAPNGTATRAETAVILNNFLAFVAK